MQEHDPDDVGARLGAALAEVRHDPDQGFERRVAGGARERAQGRRARLTAALAVLSAAAAAAMIWVLEHPGARLRGANEAMPRTAALQGSRTMADPTAAAGADDSLSRGELLELVDVDAALSVQADWDRATGPLAPYTRLLGGGR
jgi:hypothetical protein